MVKLRIESINKYKYELVDDNGEEYSLNIDLIDTEENLSLGDFIYIDKNLLDKKYEGYCQNYIFGNLDSKYGRANLEYGDIDVIKIEKEDKEILLKRLYG